MEILALAPLHILLDLVNRWMVWIDHPRMRITDMIVYYINNTVKLYKDAKYIDLSTGMAL